jgi:hypothetical protein
MKQCKNCKHRKKCLYKSIPCPDFKEDEEYRKYIEEEFPNYGR